MIPDNIYALICKPQHLIFLFLLVVGLMLKRTPKLPDWLIPYILGAIGAAAGCFIYAGIKDVGPVAGAMLGVIFAGLTVYGNQLWKQFSNRNQQEESK